MTSTRRFAGFMIIRSTPARPRPRGGPGCAGSSRRNGRWRAFDSGAAGRARGWSAPPASTASRWRCPARCFPVAGVTTVSVLPTHRRRGILRSLMHRQIADIAARGEEPIAALWASETPLYGRYGYGRASSHAFFRFRRGEGALSPLGARRPGADAAAGRAVRRRRGTWPRSTTPCCPGSPGSSSATTTGGSGCSTTRTRTGTGPARCAACWPRTATACAATRSTGARARWEAGHGPARSARSASGSWSSADPAAGAALWRDLLSRDLVTRGDRGPAAGDDPLLYQLLDSRRARVRLVDNLWVRIIDLPAALDPPRLRRPGGRGARGHRRAAAGQRRALAAAGRGAAGRR